MKHIMRSKTYDYLHTDVRAIRTAVFVEEQGFVHEFDETDERCQFIVLYDGDAPAATGRFFPGEQEREYVIGRVAVMKDYRGRGLGRQVVEEAERIIRKLGASSVMLSAQVRARGFYESMGYRTEGDIYLDEYCQHVTMRKKL